MSLHVVTHRKWVADDFTLAGVDACHHLGFDLPDFEVGDSVWAPMEWMARAQAAEPALRPDGPRLDLADPGGDFLTRLPVSLLGREVRRVLSCDIRVMDDDQKQRLGVWHDGPDAFVKPANCKIEAIPAAWYDLEGLVLSLIAAKVPDDQPLLLTYDRLDIIEEHRLWVRDGQIVTSSPYLQHLDFIEKDFRGYVSTNTWHEAMSTERTADAEAFGAHVLDRIEGPLPRAFTLDVAITTGGVWVVIEANPAWSSALYGADPAQVARCVAAASLVVDTPPEKGSLCDPHRWRPDPYLLARSRDQRPLTRA